MLESIRRRVVSACQRGAAAAASSSNVTHALALEAHSLLYTARLFVAALDTASHVTNDGDIWTLGVALNIRQLQKSPAKWTCETDLSSMKLCSFLIVR